MPPCDLCGKNTRLVTALIEGTELSVCEKCGQHGRIIQKPVLRKEMQKPKPVVPEVVENITADYAVIVRKAREKSGKTQEEFAKMLNEKESIIQKIESGSFMPSIDLARKLEKKLNGKLIEIDERINVEYKNDKAGPLTIGDFIKIKKS